MPVILPREVEKKWLDHDIVDVCYLKSLLIPYPSELMTAYQVSTLVNSPRNNVPECLVP